MALGASNSTETRQDRLSEENLRRHEGRSVSEQAHLAYAQALIKDEQYRLWLTQMYEYERANQLAMDPSALSNVVGFPATAGLSGTTIESILPRYTASDTTPLERFGFLDGANSPFPLYEKESMKMLGIEHGAMEDAHIREMAAEWTSLKMKSAKKVKEEKRRVKRKIVMRRRSDKQSTENE